MVSEAFVTLLESMQLEHPALDIQYKGVNGSFCRTHKPDPLKVIQVQTVTLITVIFFK